MKRKIFANNLNYSSHEVPKRDFEVELPGKCPCCGAGHSADPVDVRYISLNNPTSKINASLYSVYFCPACEKCFFVEYDAVINDIGSNPTFIYKIHPASNMQTTYSDNIKKLSPEFVKIFNQSEQAENQGFTAICGMGYRKSLEFLIKDYAIKFHPEKQDTIPGIQLAQCINMYIDNERIKTLAKASAWLGNDETHYMRKFENYNLQHLKLFISSVVSFVDLELSYLEAETLLSTPKQ